MWSCGILVAILAFAAEKASAYENMSLRSRYMGDGWFRYDMTLHQDPFFHSYDGCAILVEMNAFASFGSIPNGWQTFAASNGQVQVFFSTHPDFITRPLSATVWLQSSNTTYKTVDIGGASCAATCRFNDQLENPYGSANIGYVLQMRSIVPCAPEDADGSPPDCTDVVAIFPDLRMDAFIITNGSPSGISFSWDRDCTAIVRASDDLTEWRDVEYFLFSPPRTNWFPSTELTSLGSFFRAGIVSLVHKPELLPSAALGLCAESDAIAVPASSWPLQLVLTREGVQIESRVSPSEYYRLTLCEDVKGGTRSEHLMQAKTDRITLPLPAPRTAKVAFISICKTGKNRRTR